MVAIYEKLNIKLVLSKAKLKFLRPKAISPEYRELETLGVKPDKCRSFIDFSLYYYSITISYSITSYLIITSYFSVTSPILSLFLFDYHLLFHCRLVFHCRSSSCLT